MHSIAWHQGLLRSGEHGGINLANRPDKWILQGPVAEKHCPMVTEHWSVRIKKTWVTRSASFIPSSPNPSPGHHRRRITLFRGWVLWFRHVCQDKELSAPSWAASQKNHSFRGRKELASSHWKESYTHHLKSWPLSKYAVTFLSPAHTIEPSPLF